MPQGFLITPSQAFDKVFDTPGLLSRKHVWHIHTDSQYYYVHDTFLGDSSRRAYLQGVRVDGRTGDIVRRDDSMPNNLAH